MSNAIIGFLPNIGAPEVIIVLAVALLLFGGKKLPELARGLGKGLRQFKEEVSSVKSNVSDAIDSEPDYSEPTSTDDSGDKEVAHKSDEVGEDKGPDKA